jgi:hypothetical protein
VTEEKFETAKTLMMRICEMEKLIKGLNNGNTPAEIIVKGVGFSRDTQMELAPEMRKTIAGVFSEQVAKDKEEFKNL